MNDQNGKPVYGSPVDIAEGGGGLYEGWCRVIDAWTEANTRYRKDGTPTPMLAVKVIERDSGEERTELFQAGSIDTWEPDGKWFIAKKEFGGRPAQFAKYNPLGELLINLNESGFTWNLDTFRDEGCKQLIGDWLYKEHFDLTDRDGNVIMNASGYPKQRTMFTRWGGNGTQPNDGNAQSASQTPQNAQPAADVERAIESAIVELLRNGAQPVSQVLPSLFSAPPQGVATDQIGPVVSNAAWMSGADRPWINENGTLKLKAQAQAQA